MHVQPPPGGPQARRRLPVNHEFSTGAVAALLKLGRRPASILSEVAPPSVALMTSYEVAARYCSCTPAGMRPRAGTSTPLAAAQSRISRALVVRDAVRRPDGEVALRPASTYGCI